jgi:hypothetical protein
MRWSARTLAHLGLVAVLALSGCNGGCSYNSNPGYVSENTPQGQEVRRILDEDREIRPEVEAGLPIDFKPIGIDVEHKDQGMLLRPVLIWTRTGGEDEFQRFLARKAREVRPELPPGNATQVTFLLTYKGGNGEDRGSESLSLEPDKSRNTIHLKDLGKWGETRAARAEIKSIAWFVPEDTVSL